MAASKSLVSTITTEDKEPIAKLQAAESSLFASRWEQFTPYIAEFWGTLVITATFLCNVEGSGTDPAFQSICHAFMVIGVVSATKHLTGASLNPSVSLALALAGRQRLRTAAFLCLAQIAGGITGAVLCFQAGVAHELTLGPQKGHNWFQVGLLETIYACMLCLVFLNAAASAKNNPKNDQNGFIGLSVGCCYLASHNAARTVCNTVSNSAVALGLIFYGLAHGGSSVRISHGVGYFMYDLLGAFLAAGIYRVLRPQEFSSLSIVLREENAKESALLGSEFIGTFYIVLTQVSIKCSNHSDLGPQAWGSAAAVMAMVCALRDVSGAHFNPAITLAVRCSGRMPVEDMNDSVEGRYSIFYTLAQVLAGVVAAMVAGIVHHTSRSGVQETSTSGQICVAEIFGAFFLCYVVLASSTTFPVEGARSKQNNLAGIAYGSVVLANTLAMGHISGAMLNPVAVVSSIMVGAVPSKNSMLVDCIYHVIAAVFAAAAFLITHAQLYAKDAQEAEDERVSSGI